MLGEKMELNKYIDHTLLKRNATQLEIDKIINEAIEYKFKTICIHPVWVKYAKEKLRGTEVGVTVVFGFPFGTQTIESKIFEAKDAISNGANELDMVINVGKLHENDAEYLKRELSEVREATKGYIIKVIFEIALLTKEEIVLASRLAVEAGWDFIKTSTGIGVAGATVEAVELMKLTAGTKAEVKAAGGVRSREDAIEMINAGATRIGTSNGILIMKGKTADSEY